MTDRNERLVESSAPAMPSARPAAGTSRSTARNNVSDEALTQRTLQNPFPTNVARTGIGAHTSQAQHTSPRHQTDFAGDPSTEQRLLSSQVAECGQNKSPPAHTVLGKHARTAVCGDPGETEKEDAYRAERVPRTDKRRATYSTSRNDNPQENFLTGDNENCNNTRLDDDDWRSQSRGTTPSR